MKPTTDGLYALEIPKRPPKTWAQVLHALLFAVVFNVGCLMVNSFQFTILLPLKLLPFAFAEKAYEEGIRYSKGAFGTLMGVCFLHSRYRRPSDFCSSPKCWSPNSLPQAL